MTDLATRTGAAEGDETTDGVKAGDTSTLGDGAATTDVDGVDGEATDVDETADAEATADDEAEATDVDETADAEAKADDEAPLEADEPVDEEAAAADEGVPVESPDAAVIAPAVEDDAPVAGAAPLDGGTVVEDGDTAVIDDADRAEQYSPVATADDAPTTVLDDTPDTPGDDEPAVAWAPTEPRRKKRHLALWIGIPVGVALVGLAVTSTILIAPGVAIAGVPVGGMTPGAAAEAVQTALDGTTVILTSADGATIELTGAELGAAVDAKALANSAYGDHPLWNVGAWNPEPIAAPVVLETDEATAALREAGPALYVEPTDATLAFDPAAGGYVVVPAVAGTGVDVVAVESALSEALAAGEGTITIDAPAQEIEATITTPEAEAGAAQVNGMLAGSGFYIGEERTIPVDAATTASWLTVSLDEAGAPVIVADPAAMQPLIDTLPAAVNRAPINAATVVNKAGSVLRTATAGVSGRELSTTDGLADQYAAQLAQGNAAMPLPVSETPFQTVSVVRLLEVDLSDQRLYLKENDTVVDSWAISSGKSATPTFTGRYTINAHVRSQTMRGPEKDGRGNILKDAAGNTVYYETADVPWITYFNGDQAFHGVYWHSNWGNRMSHGCVGMPIPRAQQVYEWSANGTDVWIHD